MSATASTDKYFLTEQGIAGMGTSQTPVIVRFPGDAFIVYTRVALLVICRCVHVRRSVR